MNKKFLSAILFGALMVTSTGTFVSCKDYDDDIDAINKELTDVKSQIAALQAKVDAGKWITSANSTAEGVTITLSDGSTLKITNGKDGAQGEAGKDGSVVEVKEGVLYIDGEATEIKVCEEAPAALPCVKVEAGELMILQEDGTYAASGIKVGCVTAAKVNGLWTITVGDDVITVPGSAAMSYIDVLNGYTNMSAIYAINKEDVTYSPYEKTLKKGLYTTLDRDLQIVVNPQGTDASVYDFSLMNSQNVDTELKFKDAVPFEGLLTRASSENAIWVLEHDFTRYEDITDARTKNYLLFKSNDGSRHALTLSATSGETTVKTPYNLGATLRKMGETYVGNSYVDALVNEVYTPSPYSWQEWSTNAAGVYDYWLTIDEDANNVKAATLYGVEILDEGHSFRYTRETGVNNSVRLRYNYILMDGTIVEGKEAPFVNVYMVEEMASANTIVLERLETPMDADLLIARNADNYEQDIFRLTTEAYSLDALTDQMSELDKIVWKAGLNWSKTLIGGEGNNNADDLNWAAANLISYTIDQKENTIEFHFDVYAPYNGNEYYNFYLNNAYELTLTAKDPQAGNVVATIVLPFEFTQPTLDITRVSGDKAIWNEDGTVLSLYGDFVKGPQGVEDMMYAPLYEAFKTAYSVNSKNEIVWGEGAPYYTLSGNNMNRMVQGYYVDGIAYSMLQNVALTNLQITSVANEWGTYAPLWCVNNQLTPIVANYSFYGVYPATEEQVTDFTLRFASLLGDAQAIETVADSYTANNVTREVILTDEDFNLVDALGSAFFLFDGVKADGNVDKRTDMNLRQGFEEGSEGFATDWTLITEEPVAYYYKNGVKQDLKVQINKSGSARLKENTNTKTRYWEADAADANDVLVTMLPAQEAKKDAGYAAIAGGVQIQIPTSVGTTEPVTIEFTLQDVFGVQKTLSVVVKASK